MSKHVTIDQAYHSVEPLVHKTVHDFCRKYQQEWNEDYQADAMLAVVEGFHKYNPNKSRLTTWTRWAAWYGLLDSRNQRIHDGALLREPEMEGEPSIINQLPARQGFDAERFCNELSEDAAMVAKLVCEMPLDLLQLVRLKGEEDDAETIQGALAMMLREIGWSWKRIGKVWAEIGEAIS